MTIEFTRADCRRQAQLEFLKVHAQNQFHVYRKQLARKLPLLTGFTSFAFQAASNEWVAMRAEPMIEWRTRQLHAEQELEQLLRKREKALAAERADESELTRGKPRKRLRTDSSEQSLIQLEMHYPDQPKGARRTGQCTVGSGIDSFRTCESDGAVDGAETESAVDLGIGMGSSEDACTEEAETDCIEADEAEADSPEADSAETASAETASAEAGANPDAEALKAFLQMLSMVSQGDVASAPAEQPSTADQEGTPTPEDDENQLAGVAAMLAQAVPDQEPLPPTVAVKHWPPQLPMNQLPPTPPTATVAEVWASVKWPAPIQTAPTPLSIEQPEEQFNRSFREEDRSRGASDHGEDSVIDVS